MEGVLTGLYFRELEIKSNFHLTRKIRMQLSRLRDNKSLQQITRYSACNICAGIKAGTENKYSLEKENDYILSATAMSSHIIR
jgi:hypothetical protein